MGWMTGKRYQTGVCLSVLATMSRLDLQVIQPSVEMIREAHSLEASQATQHSA
jgi:hypothetical protein